MKTRVVYISQIFLGILGVGFLLFIITLIFLSAEVDDATNLLEDCLRYPEASNLDSCVDLYIDKLDTVRGIFPGNWPMVVKDDLYSTDVLVESAGYQVISSDICPVGYVVPNGCLLSKQETVNVLGPAECTLGQCQYAFAVVRLYDENNVPRVAVVRYLKYVVTPENLTFSYDPFGNVDLETNVHSTSKERFLEAAPEQIPSKIIMYLGS